MGIDIACFLVIAFAFYRGYKRGLIMALFTVAGYIIGAFATMHLSFIVSDYIAQNTNLAGTWLPLVAFALTFAIVVMIVRFFGKLIEKGMTRILPTSFNRFLGSLLYISVSLIIISLVYEVAASAGIFKDDLIAASIMVPHLETFSLLISEQVGDVIPFVRNLFEEIDAYFQNLAGTLSV